MSNCPKCGNDKVSFTIKSQKGKQQAHECLSCNYWWTDWQQAEIEKRDDLLRLHEDKDRIANANIVQAEHKIVEQQAEIESLRERAKDAEEALKFIVEHSNEWCLYCKAVEYFERWAK